MARKQSSFNYDDLDSATQDFLRQKEVMRLDSPITREPYLEQSKAIGRNATIKAFRTWIRERLQQ
jgi:hypothetical protein